ncbi:kinetochore protein Spc24-like [Centruroides vittatus]|uniref:kinetochore protein Spc24-like n=1 Tax=Centruroides vittatus TaxID=120091 RepID=UPI0035101A85
MGNNKIFTHLSDVNKQWEKLKNELHYEVKNIQNRKLSEICCYEEEKFKKELIERKLTLENKREYLSKIKRDDVDEEKKDLDKEIKEVIIYLESLKEKYQNIERSFEEKLNKNNELLNKLKESRKIGKEIIKHKNKIALYTLLTNIRWIYNSKPNELKGLILQKKEIASFSFNLETDSEFFIVNYLWDQVK